MLDGGYVAVGPYQYELSVFDPGTSDAAQRVLGSGAFWDYRLQGKLQSPPPPPPPPLLLLLLLLLLPQIPAYLIAPNALFQAGLMDIAALHQRLGNLSAAQSIEERKGEEFFLHAYGSADRYQSNRSRAQYGYNADNSYQAVQVGGNVYGVDTPYSLFTIF